ncbi:protein of unknown function [Taphrina deformans PYCC 5710]|uniref:Uncharacterized protein n=1 Tax=Taphrina deformans (strain PYCC 5710 / ATCC 11124 / CBS 356.35 / IMI 108563 / JCM 9778 / NBRC 8474) TaxID=1097556 RepID=R4XFP6_TAPDE|nr:protein of unknown function [Taphrina deformans PYCC 5710]|eukprot:CCG84578.1 protein of unknown function [Taphrina deformans PYCC 5710]
MLAVHSAYRSIASSLTCCQRPANQASKSRPIAQ